MSEPLIERVETTMPDGAVLRAHLVRPASSQAAPVPLILYRSPYLAGLAEWARLDPRVDLTRPDLAPSMMAGGTGVPLAELLAAGFAVAVQACRGTDISDGEFRWMADEYADGAATARWFATQPWCSGVLGAGASYVSATQFATSLADPDALVALSPWVAPSDIAEDMAGRGGVRAFAPSVAWAVDRVYDAAAKGGRPGPADLPRANPDPAAGEDPLAAITSLTPDEWIDRLARYPQSAHAAAWLRDAPGAFDAGTYSSEALRALGVPAFHLAGWYDVFSGGTLRNYVEMRRGPASEHQHLVVGPWIHMDQQGNLPGPFDFGPDATLAGGGIDRLQLDFWRRHGLGIEVDLPRVRLFVMGENAWRDVADWPVPDAEPLRYALGAGSLTRQGAGASASGVTAWTHDPADPLPTTGGQILMGGLGDAGAHDQRPVEARDDVVSFSTEPLAEALVVAGPVAVRLWVSADAPSVDLHATLTDVSPDGYSRILTDGALRVDLGAAPTEEPVLATFELWPTANAFGADHRLRLNVAASNWPRYATNGEAGEVRVHHDAGHPSEVEVCVLPS